VGQHRLGVTIANVEWMDDVGCCVDSFLYSLGFDSLVYRHGVDIPLHILFCMFVQVRQQLYVTNVFSWESIKSGGG
jgi:hypothetical protein